MRSIGSKLAEHLSSKVTTLCSCWKLVPRNAPPLGFTDHDNDLVMDGLTYEAQAGFEASEIDSSLGLTVDNLEASGALTSSKLDPVRLRAGDFDHAEIEIWRVNWQDVTQRILLRKGHIGEVTYGRVGFTVEVRGLSHILNQTKGRLYQFGCDAALGDERCKMNLNTAHLRGNGSVTALEQGHRFSVSGLTAYDSEWFSQGLLRWSTGANAGRQEEVKMHLKAVHATILELWQSTVFPIVAGDDFVITAGCDRQYSTCRAKFGNGINFRGFPHLPGNDFVTAFAHQSSENNGGSRNS